MRLLVVSPYFPPQPSVASLRVHAFATAWAAAGERVTVLSTAKRDDQRGLDLPLDDIELVELPYRVPRMLESVRRHRHGRRANGAGGTGGDGSTGTAAGGGTSVLAPLRRMRDRRGIYASVRMPDLTDFWVAPATAWARDHGPWDVVFSSSGPYTAHLVARVLRREGAAAAWVADFRDLWVDNHLFRGLFPFTLRERAAERGCLDEVDLITTVSEGLARRLAAKTDRPVRVVLNGFDPGATEGLDPAPAFPADGRVRLVYTGTTYGHGQDPAPLLEAWSRLDRAEPALAKPLGLVVAGRGAERWTAAARRLGLADRIEARGVVPRGEALRLQRDAAALVLLDWDDPDDGVLTGKLFEYLAAAAPIIVVGGRPGSPVAETVARARRGVPGGAAPERLATVLGSLLRDPESLRQAPDKAYLSTLRRDHQSARCLAMIREAAGGKR